MTVIDNELQPGPVHHDLERAVRGHAAITEAIREHAERHAEQITRAREATASAELERRTAGPGPH